MSSIVQRKPLVAPSSGASEGLFSETPQREPQLIPSEPPRAGCPVNPRPRNLPEYQAACRAAQGDDVAERKACEIVPGAHLYHDGRFLDVVGIDRLDPHGDVELRLASDDGLYVVRVVPTTTAVYVLAPAPDAIHAPGAGAPEGESTTARP